MANHRATASIDRPEVQQAKYRELAELFRDLLFEQQGRFNRMDEKAGRLLTAHSVVLGASAFFGKWAIETAVPPSTLVQYFLIATSVGTVCFGVRAWLQIVSVYKKSRYKFLRADTRYVDFVREQKRVNVNYCLAQSAADALELLTKKTEEKNKALDRGYHSMLIAGSLLLITGALYGMATWQTQA